MGAGFSYSQRTLKIFGSRSWAVVLLGSGRGQDAAGRLLGHRTPPQQRVTQSVSLRLRTSNMDHCQGPLVCLPVSN